MKENYYDIEKITDTSYKIYEDFQTTMYLICGSEKACLIDTGYGGGDLLGVIRSLTDLPLIVVNTHGHIDHVMGNRLFDRVYMNAADNEIYRGVADNFAEIISEPWVGEQYADILAELDVSAVRFPETENISDGDIIDLGGVKLEVMAVPGHTPGSITLINRAEKIVFSGDAIMEHVWMFLSESLPLPTYLDALRRAKERLAGIEKIYNGHYAWRPMDTALIDTMISGCEAIIAGTADGKPFENGVGSGTEYVFENWSVLCCSDR